MSKTILLTGATDGIGLEAAKRLAGLGDRMLIHGRNPEKLRAAVDAVRAATPDGGAPAAFQADLSSLAEVDQLADAVAAHLSETNARLDVLINNAGVLRSPVARTADGLDIRFAVNTVAPYRLAKRLASAMDGTGRVINLSSAAQAPVDLAALRGDVDIQDAMAAYSQSKLALTMWSRALGLGRSADAPIHVAVNPGSLLASKMVKEGFGIAGNDINIGVEILRRAALDSEFETQSGAYFDNDAGRFAPPHADALDDGKCAAVTTAIDGIIARIRPT